MGNSRQVICIGGGAVGETVCALIAGAKAFLQGFWLAFLLMVWIGIYDTCFLDWVLFANLPMFRLEGTEHMDKAYHQKWFHLKRNAVSWHYFRIDTGGNRRMADYSGYIKYSNQQPADKYLHMQS